MKYTFNHFKKIVKDDFITLYTLKKSNMVCYFDVDKNTHYKIIINTKLYNNVLFFNCKSCNIKNRIINENNHTILINASNNLLKFTLFFKPNNKYVIKSIVLEKYTNKNVFYELTFLLRAMHKTSLPLIEYLKEIEYVTLNSNIDINDVLYNYFEKLKI